MKLNVNDAGTIADLTFTRQERRTLRNAIALLEQVGFHMRGSTTGDRLIVAGETASQLLADTKAEEPAKA